MGGQFPPQGQGQGGGRPNGAANRPGSAAALMQGMLGLPTNVMVGQGQSMPQQQGGATTFQGIGMQQLQRMQQLQQNQGGQNGGMGGGGTNGHAAQQQAQAQQSQAALVRNAWNALQRGQGPPPGGPQGQGGMPNVNQMAAQGMAANNQGQVQTQNATGMMGGGQPPSQDQILLQQQNNIIQQLQRQLQLGGGGGAAMPQNQSQNLGQQGGLGNNNPMLQQQQQQQQSQSSMGRGGQQQPGQQNPSYGGLQLPSATQALRRNDSFGNNSFGNTSFGMSMPISRQNTRDSGGALGQMMQQGQGQGQVPNQIQLQNQHQQQQQLLSQMQQQQAQMNALLSGQPPVPMSALSGQNIQGMLNAQALQQAQGGAGANPLMGMLAQNRAAPNATQTQANIQSSTPAQTPSQQVMDAMRKAASSASSAQQASMGSDPTPQPQAQQAPQGHAQNQHQQAMVQMLQQQMAAAQSAGQGGGPAAASLDPRARQLLQAQQAAMGGNANANANHSGAPIQMAQQMQQLQGIVGQQGALAQAASAAAQGSAPAPSAREAEEAEMESFLMGVAPDPIADGVANAQVEPTPVGSNSGGGNGKDGKQSFLDGHFAGGWQSNDDLPDRRRIIFSIIKVIERMRPDANQLSQNRLPLMAKKLEEHLYRSAPIRDDYVDPASLKRRLHVIAKGVGIPTDDGDGDASAAEGEEAGSTAGSAGNASQPVPSQVGSGAPQAPNGGAAPAASNGQPPAQNPQAQAQLAQLQQQISQAQQAQVLQNAAAAAVMPQDLGDGDAPANVSKADKKKTILLQQQRRLLLLRHASKCKGGASCRTKFCPQSKDLWKHMKKCRNKTCVVSHCLSSRCVLNHYRMCKAKGKTAACPICAPVMKHIKQSGKGGGGSGDELDTLAMSMGDSDGVDPLDADAIGPIDDGAADQGGGATRNQLLRGAMSSTSSLTASFGASLPANPPNGQAIVGVPKNQTAADAAQSQQGQQEELQKKRSLLQQVQQQQGNLFGQSQRLQQQLQSASNPEQAEQLQKQQDIVQQLNRQFVEQRTILQSEIVAAQQQQQQQQGNLGSGATSKRSSDLISTNDAQPKESEDSLRPNKMPKVGDLASSPTKSDNPQKADGGDSKPSPKKGPVSEEARRFAQIFRPLVKRLVNHDHGWVFKDPVDPIELGVPEYFEIVENPMDLTLVMNKLDEGVYQDVSTFERETKLVFQNAIIFNGEESDVGGMAKELLAVFAADLKNTLNGQGIPPKMPLPS